MKHIIKINQHINKLLFGLIFFSITSAEKVYCQIEKPNIIFIVIDDLNDYTEGLNGHPQIQTPNIKRLEERGILFSNAYCNAPGCAPSRTSFLSGKDLDYVQVYTNTDYNSTFRNNFSIENKNEKVFTLPEILKDSGDYFTFAINKIFHASSENDFDTIETDPCNKSLSWNKMLDFGDKEGKVALINSYKYDSHFDYGILPDSLEKYLQDDIAVDTTITFLQQVNEGTINTCGNPFFLALGMHYPHGDRIIPDTYFPENFVENIFDEPFNIPYNNPPNTYPYNGFVMPPQPDIQFGDYENLESTAKFLADQSNFYESVFNYLDSLPSLPIVDLSLTSDENNYILQESMRTNIAISYFAAVQFLDAQIGRLLDALDLYPELKANTMIILVSDNGYALGEKKHWAKWALWNTDTRIPFIISHPDFEENKIAKQTVSLLDLFPTVLELTNTPTPTFSDGSMYLDGINLYPILENTDIEFERPTITSYKKTTSTASCFPHFSIQNERFHFLRYQTNNNGLLGNGVCDSLLSLQQDELYEVGSDRNIDPNEWFNLAYEPEYKIVKEYLQQWFPDSAKYLQKTYKVKMQTDQDICNFSKSDTVSLSSLLYEMNGEQLFSVPESKHLVWFTNLTTDTVSGFSFNLPLASISSIANNEEDQLFIYLALYNEDYSVIDALDLVQIRIDNPINTSLVFQLETNQRDLLISNIEYPIGTTNAIWDFGDGFIYTGLLPPLHTYNLNGNYNISCTAFIGVCSEIRTEQIRISSISKRTVDLFPNPAHTLLFLNVEFLSEKFEIEIYNTAGVKMMQKEFIPIGNINQIFFNIQSLYSGTYFIRIKGNEIAETLKFIKM